MEMIYSESPSFSQGWCVVVDTRKKVVHYRLVDAFGLSSHSLSFLKSYSSMSLEAEDEVLLSQLLDNVCIKVDQQVGVTLDGTCRALSIRSGSNVIGLEWNSDPLKGTGVEALVDKMCSLAEACKAKRG